MSSKRTLARVICASVLFLIILYFLLWPVPVEPVAWIAPPATEYAGPFVVNTRLQALERIALGDCHGPEDIVLDDQGRIYAATHEGCIVRCMPDGSKPRKWARTGGRPLGLAFDPDNNLIVADAYKGLLSIAQDGGVTVLTTMTEDGVPIRYANNVDVAENGRIYFSDASTRFGAEASGGITQGSLLEIMEHAKTGRLLVYDPTTRTTRTLLKNLSFANGVAVSRDQRSVLVVETGEYRLIRYWLEGPRKASAESLIEALPGFPDNITTGKDGRYWIGLISPRSTLLDSLAEKPFLRKLVQRLPAFVRPRAVSYGHVIAVDGEGNVLLDMQDPDGSYPLITCVAETRDYLYFGSLVAPTMARLSKTDAGVFTNR